MNPKIQSGLIMLVLVGLSLNKLAAENIVFPDDANVINIKTWNSDPALRAKGDGATDDTEAFRAAIANGRFIYVPNGTYIVSDQINFPKGGSNTPNRVIIQGQSRDGTIIRLPNNAPGYDGNPSYEWVKGYSTLTINAAGQHTVDVAMRSDGFGLDKIILTKDGNFTPTSIYGDSLPESTVTNGRFIESGGKLVMEAEHFNSIAPGTGTYTGSSWTQVSNATASGGIAMKASPDRNLSAISYNAAAPKMTYNVTISSPGTYHIWLKRIGVQNGGDVHIAFNNAGYTVPFNNVNTTGKTIFRVSQAPEQAFRNSIRNMTFHMGSGNPGAEGIRYYASNQGSLEDVLFTSSDGGGSTAINLGFYGGNGPLLIKNVTVQGFKVGINASAGHAAALENITLQNQKTAGITCSEGNFFLNNLTSSQNLNVPAINVTGGDFVLLNGTATGPAGGTNAVVVGAGRNAFIRNLKTTNYSKAILFEGRDAAGPNVAEWSSKDATTLYPSAGTSLNLPIKQAPEVPWDEDMGKWANALDYGGGPVSKNINGRTLLDYGPCIQAAIDSGKSTVYIPKMDVGYQNGIYSDVRIRGNVKRIIFMESTFGSPFVSGLSRFILDEGTAPVVVFERVDATYGSFDIVQASSRTLIVRNLSVHNIHVLPNTGDVFLEDVTSELSSQMLTMGANTNVWARQLNPEGSGSGSGVRNYGGNLWVLGMKTEGNSNKIYAEGGANEIYAFILANTGGNTPVTSIMEFVDSRFSAYISEDASIRQKPFDIKIRETRGGDTRTLDNTTGTVGAEIPLFVGYQSNAPALPPKPNAAPSQLTATAVSTTQIRLNWVDNSSNESGYKVERKSTVGKTYWEEVAKVTGTNLTTWTDTGLDEATRYYYRIRAFNAGGNSNYSNQVDGLTQSGGASTIIVSQSFPVSGTINLTTEGSLDWAKWGSTSTTSFVHKATGGTKISTWTAVGTGHSRSSDSNVRHSWSDGTPTASGTSDGFVRCGGGAGRGYEFTVDATTELRTLNLYVFMQYGGFGVLTLSMDNSSAPVKVFDNLNGDSKVIVQYKANAATKMRVKLTTFNGTGNLSLRAASLSAGWEEPGEVLPVAPSQLASRAMSNGQIDLFWQDDSTNETGFKVERAPDVSGAAGAWTEIATTAPNTSSYSSTGLATNTRYWYRVRATNASGSSSYSPQTSATTLATSGGTVAAPTFNPPSGTYSSAQSVTLASTTSGASIRYTTNGSNPTASTGTLYSGSPVVVGGSMTLKAIAYKSGMTSSAVTSASYTINIPPPAGGSGQVTLSQSGLTPYDTAQDGGSSKPTTGTVSSDGRSVTLTGNSWKKFTLPAAYTVQSTTMMEVTVNATSLKEIIGIALENDNTGTNTPIRTFRLGGSQYNDTSTDVWSWKIAPAYVSGDGAVTYVIPVGSYFTGAVNYIGFIADDDATGLSNVTYSDIRIYEPPAPISFAQASLSAYDATNQDGSGGLSSSGTVSGDGKSITITGNAWKKHAFTYGGNPITANTVMEVTVNASDAGEILGIALENDNLATNTPKRSFRLGGSDVNNTWHDAWSWKLTPAYTAGSGAATYVIPVGGFFTGSVSSLAFIGDDDANGSTNAVFSNILIYEEP